jgi:hypothetical protein
MFTRTLAAAIVISALLLPAGAAAATRTGSSSDPSGDGPAPAMDLVKASVAYKTKGSLKAKVSLAAAPEDGSLIGVFVDKQAASDPCLGGSGLVLGYVVGSGAFGVLDGKDVKAKGSLKGTALTITAGGKKVARQRWSCANAAVGPASSPDPADSLDRPVRLK